MATLPIVTRPRPETATESRPTGGSGHIVAIASVTWASDAPSRRHGPPQPEQGPCHSNPQIEVAAASRTVVPRGKDAAHELEQEIPGGSDTTSAWSLSPTTVTTTSIELDCAAGTLSAGAVGIGVEPPPQAKSAIRARAKRRIGAQSGARSLERHPPPAVSVDFSAAAAVAAVPAAAVPAADVRVRPPRRERAHRPRRPDDCADLRPRHGPAPDRRGEVCVWYGHPPRPGATVDVARRRQRRPAGIAVHPSPADPRRRPLEAGDPVPTQARTPAPAAIMEDDVAPRDVRHERPAGRAVDPPAVGVRLPVGRDGRHPDVAVVRRHDPVAIGRKLLIERLLAGLAFRGCRRLDVVVGRGRRRRLLVLLGTGGGGNDEHGNDK